MVSGVDTAQTPTRKIKIPTLGLAAQTNRLDTQKLVLVQENQILYFLIIIITLLLIGIFKFKVVFKILKFRNVISSDASAKFDISTTVLI